MSFLKMLIENFFIVKKNNISSRLFSMESVQISMFEKNALEKKTVFCGSQAKTRQKLVKKN